MRTTATKLAMITLLALTANACTPKGHVTAPQFENGQYTFTDPDQAADALKEAVEKQDKEALAKIFGPQGGDIISSGDPIEDTDTMRAFAEAMDEHLEIQETTNQNPALKNQQLAFLLVGQNEYPFPVAMYKQANGWRFDTPVGKQEIVDRRIGKNEIRAIHLAHQFVGAQRRYRLMMVAEGKPAQYARKFFSSPGKHDGLYWEEQKDKPMSPFGPMVAAASDEGYTVNTLKSPVPYNGYHFDILTRQGSKARGGAMSYIDGSGRMSKGFAMIAYPAVYGLSGVVTFMVGPDGIVYQKNLGPKTSTIARNIQTFDPDLSWVPVQ
jgi:hypothetical protein